MHRLLLVSLLSCSFLPIGGAAAETAAAGKRPHVVFILGADEYRCELTMPRLANEIEGRFGFQCTVLQDLNPASVWKAQVNQRVNDIPGLEVLDKADLIVLYMRFRTLPEAQLPPIERYLKAGKPVVGLRTSTHAFNYAKEDPLAEKWNAFGAEVLGAPWIHHYGHASSTDVTVAPNAKGHPILTGVTEKFHVRSWLYQVLPDYPPKSATPLLEGRSVGPGRDPVAKRMVNPVAWTYQHPGGGRVFTTTMGHPDDFSVPGFRRLLINGILWALDQPIPAELPLRRLFGKGDVVFKMHTISAESRFEGGGIFDVNNDGKLDIFCGGFWYEAPNWTKHFVRDIKEQDNYFYDFCALPLDVDGDGWTDSITAAWHNKRISWIRNPGEAGGEWKEIPIDEPGNMETAMLADVNADGQSDVLPNVFVGTPAWYELHRDKKAENGARWERHLLPAELAGPGIGAGDVNSDGRMDIVGCKGWAEQTGDPAKPWIWHSEFDLTDPSIPILVYDVDGDGDTDLVWGIGHNYGLYWLEQELNATGQRCWAKHEIDKSWSQAHVVLLADLDDDYVPEVVSGKRYYAHNGRDPGENEPRCLYYYRFNPGTRGWTRHVIHEGGPAGTGTATELRDIDGDGDPDLLAPGKSGLFLFENLGIRK